MSYHPYDPAEFNVTDRGFLLPRLNTAERNAIQNPYTGLLIFNTDTEGLEVNTLTGWVPVLTSGSTEITASDLSNGTSGSGEIVLATAPTIASPTFMGTVTGLSAGEVSGLAAVATSGSASDLATGTLPNARLSGVPNSALAESSITIAGHTVSLGGSQPLAASDLTNGVTGSGEAVLATSPTIASPTFTGTVAGAGTVPNSALQNSSITIAGHTVTLGGSQPLAASDLTNGITGSGDVVLATSPTIASPTFTGTVSGLSAGEVTGLAASATTDTTNASNITTGTLPNARLSAVPNSALANSSITIAGHTVTLGGTQALAASDLANGTSGSGDIILQNSPSIVSPTISGVIALPVVAHVASNSALQAATTTAYPNGVWRDTFGNGNGSPPLFYLPSSTAPAAVDNGYVVASADSKYWVAVLPDSGASVRQWGAYGDGVHDDTAAIQACVNFCFGQSGSPHEPNRTANTPLFFPPGTYNISSPIQFYQLTGARIYGAGRFTTAITNVASGGGSIFKTNGFQYSSIAGMLLTTGGTTAVIVDLDWDGTGSYCALQSNTFSDCYFSGGGIGVRIGQSGNMGSETLFLNNYFSNCAIAGIETENFNALQQTVIGGDFANCGIGIHIPNTGGSVPTIRGVGFQGNTNWDIQISGYANDAYCIAGCRSESLNFLDQGIGASVVVAGCSQTNSSSGVFATAVGGPMVLIGCTSVAGTVTTNTQAAVVRIGCKFTTDWAVGGGQFTSLDGQPGSPIVFTVNSNTGTTLIGRYISGGVILRTGSPGSSFSDTTDTAANIIARAPLSAPIADVSSAPAIRVRILNQTSQTMTLNGGTGVTMVGTNTIAAGASHDFIGIVTNADTPTISFYG